MSNRLFQNVIAQMRDVIGRNIGVIDDNGIIRNMSFIGGCNGNLKAISKLCEGQKAENIKNILAGNTCGYRNTSCADQLAKAIEKNL